MAAAIRNGSERSCSISTTASSSGANSSASQIGLDEWIKLHTSTLTGSIDEDGCYADAGFETLKRRQSHGAHVMDVAGGAHSDLVACRSLAGPSRSAELAAGHGRRLQSRRRFRAILGRLRPRCDRRVAQGLCCRRHPVHPVICRPEKDKERGHQRQLRANDRTARWYGRAGGRADGVGHGVRRQPRKTQA